MVCAGMTGICTSFCDKKSLNFVYYKKRGMQTIKIDRSKEWTADPDVPHLFLVGEGKVSSTVIPSLEFDLKAIF